MIGGVIGATVYCIAHGASDCVDYIEGKNPGSDVAPKTTSSPGGQSSAPGNQAFTGSKNQQFVSPMGQQYIASANQPASGVAASSTPFTHSIKRLRYLGKGQARSQRTG